MRIFYIHQYFKTPAEGGAIRSWYLSTGLAARGVRVEMITAHDQVHYLRKEIDGVVVHYLPVPYDNAYGFLRRIHAFYKFVRLAVKLMKQLEKPDLCYATSTPLTVGLAAMWLKKRRNVPYFFEVRDLWPEAPIEMGYFKDPVTRSVVKKLEKRIYREAEKIVCLSPGIRDHVAAVVPGKPLHLIPNMSDTTYFVPSSRVGSRPDDTLNISYFGAVGPVNHLEFLLDAAKASLESKLRVHFNIAGAGSRLEALKQMAEEQRLKNVTFTGKLTRVGIRELLDSSDVVYISFKDIPVLETNSPNKFFDALAAGKMCVVNTGGWIAGLLERHRAGFFTDPSDPQDFVRKIEPFVRDPKLLESYQENARMLAVEKFSRKQLCDMFYQAITRAGSPTPVNKELAYILNP